MQNPIPGEAGTDYPVYTSVPDTDFLCSEQQYPGIYPDTGAGCQAGLWWSSNGLLFCEDFRPSTSVHPADSPPASSARMGPSSPSSTLCVTGGTTWTVLLSLSMATSTSSSTSLRLGQAVRLSSVWGIRQEESQLCQLCQGQ